MTAELIISIISLVLTFIVGILTVITNIRVSKINNIKDYKENNKHITPFELQFRDEAWLYDIIVNKDEFYKYDESSQKRITKWFEKYANTHTLKKLLPIDVEHKQEEQKPVKEKVEETKEDLKELPTEIVTQIVPRQVKITNPELINTIINGKHLVNPTGPRTKLPKSAQVNLRDYPIGSSTITRTPIITNLVDEFDEEDKKKRK